eukprot:TRINITY_DN18845_c0_g2_i1.p1 TRINITY_DN18845_c0_g2~~TRINITY_DN18845_c0_g2_i1.p1  ORF type:complete len:885 (+),score=270.50 TRINITY_DN18845_c0_g2_i1:192-2846(+)
MMDTVRRYAVGDHVTFRQIKGLDHLNGRVLKISEKGEEGISVKVVSLEDLPVDHGDCACEHKYGSGWLMAVNKPVHKTYRCFRESLSTMDFDKYHMIDMRKFEFGPMHLHGFLRALLNFKSANNRLPKPGCDADADAVFELAQGLGIELFGAPIFSDENADKVKRLAKTSGGSLSAMASIMGGFVAQEVTKLSGKYTPIDQWLQIDFLETLADEMPTGDQVAATGGRYDGTIAVYGKPFQDKVANLRAFVVGAGALGCEIAKGLCMLGAGTGSNGAVSITDMDTIERSNLSRQFLFRAPDIDSFKSTAAKRAMLAMNPDMKIEDYTEAVGPATETEQLFGHDFWDRQDVLINALDSITARHYVDSKACLHGKPLLESGTTGVMGNFMVVLPNITACYRDGKTLEDGGQIPVCTLKGAPYEALHCIMWAIEHETDGSIKKLFELLPVELQRYLTDPAGFLGQINLKKSNEFENYKDKLEFILEALELGDIDTCFSKCVKWARNKFDILFHHPAAQKLHKFPPDAVLEDGTAYYGGKRKCPAPQEFDPNNSYHVWFVYSAANLRAANFGVRPLRIVDQTSLSEFLNLVAQVEPLPFVPEGGAPAGLVRMPSGGLEQTDETKKHVSAEEIEALVAALQVEDPHGRLQACNVHPQKFEKDDDSNFHVDYCTAATNMRALNFDIPLSERLEVKLTAGKIIPAIQTTTAMIVGFVMMELCQIVQGRDTPEDFLEAAVNVGVPDNSQIFCPAEPKSLKTDKLYKTEAIEMADMGMELVLLPPDATTQTVIFVEQPTLSLEETLAAVVSTLDPEGEHGLQIGKVMGGAGATLWFDLPKFDDRKGLTMAELMMRLSLIHISEPTRLLSISYAVFCLKKKKNDKASSKKYQLTY